MAELKLFNGSHYVGASGATSLSVAAHSRADAARMLASIFGGSPSTFEGEMKRYWSPCWGNSMDGVIPERGVWLHLTSRARPLRLWVESELSLRMRQWSK